MVGSEQGMGSDARLVGTLSESRGLSGSGLCHEGQQLSEHKLDQSEGACEDAPRHGGCQVMSWLVAAVGVAGACCNLTFLPLSVFLSVCFMQMSLVGSGCDLMSSAGAA